MHNYIWKPTLIVQGTNKIDQHGCQIEEQGDHTHVGNPQSQAGQNNSQECHYQTMCMQAHLHLIRVFQLVL